MAKPDAWYFNCGKPLCTAAYGVAEAAAVAACATLKGPAVPICIAAAHATGNLRKRADAPHLVARVSRGRPGR
ncbi:MAG: hypothetical protein ACREDO_00670 [Methyloceanibacter sp.]